MNPQDFTHVSRIRLGALAVAGLIAACGGDEYTGNSDVDVNTSESALLPPGGFPPIPTFDAALQMSTRTPSSLKVRYRCGPGSNNGLYRSKEGQAYERIATLNPCTVQTNGWSGYYTDSGFWSLGLQPGTNYCYRIKTEGTLSGEVEWSGTVCDTTLWWRKTFTGLGISANAASSIAASFDWQKTDPLPETESPGRPTLFYMMALISQRDPDVAALTRLGVKHLEAPLFEDELPHPQHTLALDGDEVVGEWIFTVMPGKTYNQIRKSMQADIAKGLQPVIRAVAFRRIPVMEARHTLSDASRLDYAYLGEHGFKFDVPEPSTTPSPFDGCPVGSDPMTCTPQPKMLGWLASHIIKWVGEGIEGVISGIQQALGAYHALVEGEVWLTLNFVLRNIDPAFTGNSATTMVSGWSGQEIKLDGVRVRVRQGIAEFAKNTDANGQVRLQVAKNRSMEICVDAENDFVEISEHFTEKLVCIKSLDAITSDTVDMVEVDHPYLTMLASMTDAARYMETVANHEMEKVRVLVGPWADTVALTGKAFAGCMGRTPNLLLGGAPHLLGALSVWVLPLTIAAEAAYTADIIMPEAYNDNRGVAVHEYGHVVMCDLLKTEGPVKFQHAWTDVILETATQEVDDESSIIAEAFADFIASQVVGGTNYFSVSGSSDFNGFDYCITGNGDGLDNNKLHADGAAQEAAFKARVGWAASILHDAFDGHAAGTDTPNDGCHFSYTPPALEHEGHMTSQNLDDESFMLQGDGIKRLFSYWDDRSTWGTLNFDTFLGGLGDMLEDEGHTEGEVCSLFEAHEPSGVCPSFL